MKNKKLAESNVKSYISGNSKLSIVECRLLDVDNQINNYCGKYDDLNLSLLKYERIQLVKNLFTNQ